MAAVLGSTHLEQRMGHHGIHEQVQHETNVNNQKAPPDILVALPILVVLHQEAHFDKSYHIPDEHANSFDQNRPTI